jgi:hypothetical protein
VRTHFSPSCTSRNSWTSSGFAPALSALALALLAGLVGCHTPGLPQSAPPSTMNLLVHGQADVHELESDAAFDRLLASIVETRLAYLGQDQQMMKTGGGDMGPADVADGNRYLLHVLMQALVLELESSPSHPWLQRIVTPWLKLGGDNADAIYHVTPLDGLQAYRVVGHTAGAVYTSITVEAGGQRGGYAGRIAGVLNDTPYDVDENGRFEIFVGGPERDTNWMTLPEDASRLSVRHYFEDDPPAASVMEKRIPMFIEVLNPGPPPPTPNDASIAEAIERVERHFRSWTIDQPMPNPLPTWLSLEPNIINDPLKPGTMAYAAKDAAYTQAPWALAPDEALLLTGRWPEARFGNVTIWNRFIQSFDYRNRNISLNRKQTTLESDGSFRIILAHEDPGVPNWLDTEGRPGGVMFWRFMLPEGEIETPKAKVVKFKDIVRSAE